MNRIAIVTCDAFVPDGFDEDRLLVQACIRAGLHPELVSWSDPSVDWDAFGLSVLRSTWDYTQRRKEFLEWVLSVPRLCNPAAVVLTNTDKRYLADLTGAGLPVVPTTFVAPGDVIAMPTGGQFILKPSIGAGSRGAGRFDAAVVGDLERAQAHAADLHAAGATVLVQPYVDGVDQHGETALIYLEGRFSHAIRKGPMLTEGAQYPIDGPALFIPEQITPRIPDEAELAVAQRVLNHFTDVAGEQLLYARIDVLPSENGPVLIEAELTEPSLFLGHHPAAAERLAGAIAARLSLP